KKLFLRESLNQPLILIFEDLHWIDGETQGFLDVLSESVASAKLLLLTNYRPEYRHEWGQKTYYTQLRLAPLGKAEVEEFLDALLGIPVGTDLRVGPQEGAHIGAPLHDLKRLIVDKTQGTPFFMEEVVQELREQGVLADVGARRAVPLPTDLHIPSTVQAILAARIDRLASDEKALLQQLAVIGRQFPLSLVRQVLTQSEAELYRLLASLQHKEFLYEQPAFPEVEYIFKHALTQDVAYGTVLQDRRKGLHEQTGQAIELLYKDKVDEHYGELAHHYQRSGNVEKAIEYLQLAGQQAVQRAALQEAIGQFTTALEMVKSRPETPERNQQELTLCLALGMPFVLTKGHGASEVEAVYSRAYALCTQGEDTLQRFSAFLGLRRFYFVRGDFDKALEFGQQLFTVARNLGDASLEIRAHAMQAELRLMLGEFSRSRDHQEQGLRLYTPERRGAHVFLFGNDAGVGSKGQLALALGMLGYLDQAPISMQEALALAYDIQYPFDITRTLALGAILAQICRDPRLVQERAEAFKTLAAEHGFSLFSGWGLILNGWALAEQGQAESGIQEILSGLDTLKFINTQALQTYWLTLLADTYRRIEQVSEGLNVVAEALGIVDRTGERWWEAELYRLKGELLLMQADKLKD
ncbi:MAG: hypothetical protein HY267_08725, partial [Deltaproteobacteria bacterium]|nr:hypothetical protein [Deltaproteobacteria bacterium]